VSSDSDRDHPRETPTAGEATEDLSGVGNGRRKFLVDATGLLGVLAGAAVVAPLVGAAVGSAFRTKRHHFANVTTVSALPINAPSDVTFSDKTTDAFIRETRLRSVWCLRRSATEVKVYSPICPHLGCRYDWRPGLGRFVCPCHGSEFSLDGRVLAGPAPRPLDTLPTRIREGELFVQWEIFKLGIRRKISV
jgi:menaquinol-cytochrome c reductase iron-sulfur subunit